MKYETLEAIRNELTKTTARSAWSRGVERYTKDLIADIYMALQNEEIAEVDLAPETIESVMLNGARDWTQYSEGGCSLVYDEYIARRLCTPSELKRTYYGAKDPNPRETWLDVQARALWQAANMIKAAATKVASHRKEAIPAA